MIALKQRKALHDESFVWGVWAKVLVWDGVVVKLGKMFIYLWLYFIFACALLSRDGERGCFLAAALGLLIAVSSLIAEHCL